MSRIVDRQWGSQVVNHGASPNGVLVSPAWPLMLAVSDAGALARLLRWPAVSTGTNADGLEAVTREEA